MPRFLIQTDKEVSTVERAALYLLDEPFERAALNDLGDFNHDASLCPVGSVEFVRARIAELCLPVPKPIDYPFSLSGFFGRYIRLYGDCRLLPPDSFPVFVKPVVTKAWTGKVLTKDSNLSDLPGLVWISDVVAFKEEFRVYVLKRGTGPAKILFISRYDEFEDGPESAPPEVVLKANEMIQLFEKEGFENGGENVRSMHHPCAYALDLGITTDGQILLVEVTDAWAAGLYKPASGLFPNYRNDYFDWLYARWQQIAAAESLPVCCKTTKGNSL
ncbi:ATP-grasp domain-containing protein [Ferrovum myxofaciens]|uniref:ATP-grasp domain-containing protein n=1 Tax=Ferrovum myxofaciens TaxID=416213 RepID=A0A9E6MZ83_9PROT|nr:ATP-grasp domain-containing protein [Ferrovum myxofaciens]QKE37434.1 MAG: ATP-grasp domain-containing protein [Ferrovum myxofaciens]QWY75081.1 MAG: ATP-grasp domain-containing protein [Ferrovum myxofaciens]QWY77817.1 MAG: ATP-grasp domain-containing protein [Ferrovum myxofaciens]